MLRNTRTPTSRPQSANSAMRLSYRLKTVVVVIITILLTNFCSLYLTGRAGVIIQATSIGSGCATPPALNLKNEVNSVGSSTACNDSQPTATSPVCHDKQAPSCVTPEKSCVDNNSLPEFIFVAGIERSGHHLIRLLFDTLTEKGRRKPYIMKEFTPAIHLLDPISITNNQHMEFATIHKSLFQQRLSPLLKQMNQLKREGGRGLLVYANSFLLGYSTMSTARPDLLVLKYFDCILYRLKIIVTKRHPLVATVSAVRKFGKRRFQEIINTTRTKNLQKLIPPEDLPYLMQARIVEDQLIYLDQQVRRLACDQLHFLNVEELYSEQTKWTQLNNLAKFLRLTDTEAAMFRNVTIGAPFTRIVLPPTCSTCTNKVLYDFFEARKDFWPLMAV